MDIDLEKVKFENNEFKAKEDTDDTSIIKQLKKEN